MADNENYERRHYATGDVNGDGGADSVYITGTKTQDAAVFGAEN